MKKNITKLVSLLILLLTIGILVPMSAVHPALAAEKTTQKDAEKSADIEEPEKVKRLSIEHNLYRINGEGMIRVFLKDHVKSEKVTLTYPKNSASVKKCAWDGDILVLKVTAMKNKAVNLTVQFGEEEVSAMLILDKGIKKEPEDMYLYMYDAMVQIKTVDSEGQVYIGSGFFVGEGEVITNFHVVEAASKIVISDYYGKKYEIDKILAYSVANDLILFSVEKGNKSSLSIATSVRGGERVYCMGSPLGLSSSFVTGVVANPSLYVGGERCVQLSMPGGKGIGGAPVVNAKGQVVGVMCMSVPDAQSMSFAIDYAAVRAFLRYYTEESGMSMKDFFFETRGEKKESNDYWGGTVTGNLSTSGYYTGEELDATEIYDKTYHSMVEIVCVYGKYGQLGYSTGSGFFISPDTVVTNWHVVDEYTYLYIYDYDQNLYTMASKAEYCEESDVSTFRVTSDVGLGKHEYLEVAGYYTPRAGERVYTFGNPAMYNGTFSEAIVSIPKFELNGYDHIAYSGPNHTGSSGGALLNKYGQVIGITSIKLLDVENLGLAVAIKYLGEL